MLKRTGLIALLIGASINLFAQNITGKVTNKTTGKAAANEEVVLLSLTQGMDEEARTTTNAQGEYKFTPKDPSGRHLIRVNHSGVNYFTPAPSGATTANVDVYDAAKKVDGVTTKADIIRAAGDSGALNITEMYVVENNSAPARTQMSDKSYEIVLPDGAVVDSSLAAGPGGMPVTSAPVPTGDKNHFAFLFPIRPGETKFQVQYHMPYSGNAAIQAQVLGPTENVVVMLPKTMQFKDSGGGFQAQGEEAGLNVYVAKNAAAGQKLAYTVSGEGAIPDEEAQGGNAGGGQAAQQGPGGGIGVPESTPHPLEKYQWWILGAMALGLGGGAWYMMNMKPANAQGAVAAAPVAPAAHVGAAGVRVQHAVGAGVASHNGLLLTALKEELFQLETDRLEGRISDQEYTQAKSAFDLIIRRSIARDKKAGAKA